MVKGSIALTVFAGLALPAVGWAQEEDEIVRQAFVQAFGTSPVVAPSVNGVRSAEAAAAIAAGRRAVASPSDRALEAEFADRLGMVVGAQGSAKVLDTLFLVLRASISELNDDKRYWLKKLAETNRMGDELSDYLEELAGASRELEDLERGSTGEARSTRTAAITVRTFDPVWLETLTVPLGNDRAVICDPCMTTRAATLNAEQVQREQESILGLERRLLAARRTAVTQQAEIDRRSEAVVRMLAAVLRTIDQARQATPDPHHPGT